ncbi:aldose 1-epimerase family protein [Microbacterium sp. 4R-513]|uniref:aldose 1-epimerase family protein n=1 Tax=Microbacterium sp. 4R-513 TaxID=2567934 RepID=UPI0013E11FC6|nr:aldose 1-epimerase family protein [Microbacterium sp. 4R-513]QIG38843.1 aldose 1-epimerase family protein [Microbacterium sp. 4R-513]
MTDIHRPTGEQYLLRSADGRATAEITEVGASLRAFAVDGVDLVPRYPLDAPTPAGSGIVLVPWPNRVRDGKWTQRGETRQLAITEPATGNASHGLLRFASYTVAARDEASVTLAAPVVPQTGYPFHLGTSVTYALEGTGIVVRHAITNLGSEDAPVALGTHPYVCIGDVDTADLVLRSSGSVRFVLDDKKVPTGEEPVDAATDLRSGRRVGELSLDTAFSDLVRDADGRVRTTLSAPDGRSLTLWQGEGFDYVQVFTTDRYPGHPLALAVEPMTAPADALNSGRSLRWLAPGETWELHWGIAFDPTRRA